MFERFTDAARQVVVLATESARAADDDRIRAAHLLVGVAALDDDPAGGALRSLGLDAERLAGLIADLDTVSAADAEALGRLGIDFDAVRARVESTFGSGALGRGQRRRAPRGHLPFSPAAKKSLELALRQVATRHDDGIAAGHIAVGVLSSDDPEIEKLLHGAGVELDGLRRAVETTLGGPRRGTAPEPPHHPHRLQGLDHVSIGVSDLDGSARFYDELLATVGVHRLITVTDAIGYGTEQPFFWLGATTSPEPARELHVAFTAENVQQVLAFRAAADRLEAHVVHEPPSFPEYHPGYVATFVRDPDGNNVEAVCHRGGRAGVPA